MRRLGTGRKYINVIKEYPHSRSFPALKSLCYVEVRFQVSNLELFSALTEVHIRVILKLFRKV